jgi:hypothetical protein
VDDERIGDLPKEVLICDRDDDVVCTLRHYGDMAAEGKKRIGIGEQRPHAQIRNRALPPS